MGVGKLTPESWADEWGGGRVMGGGETGSAPHLANGRASSGSVGEEKQTG